MRISLLGLMATVLLALFTASGAGAADRYKWCAQYSGGMGAENCGFVTREQCQADVGTGGFCRENPFYTGASSDERPAKATKPRKREPG